MLAITEICEILMGAALALRISGCASNNAFNYTALLGDSRISSYLCAFLRFRILIPVQNYSQGINEYESKNQYKLPGCLFANESS